jgi:hypothetical protein
MNRLHQLDQFLQVENYLETKIYEKLHAPANLKEVRELTERLYLDTITNFYAPLGIRPTTGIYNFLIEPLKNARFHGNESFTVSLYCNSHATVLGVNDGGDYFKQPKVKRIWEAKEPVLDRHPLQERELGWGAGAEIIYDLADHIHVDNGTLYVGALTSGVLFEKLSK